MSRFQLAWAILMFLGVPAMTLMIALAPFKFLDGENLAEFPAPAAIGLYVTFLLMYLSPKLAGLRDILLRPGERCALWRPARFLARRGDRDRVLVPPRRRHDLPARGLHDRPRFGRSVVWNGQARDARGIAWATACAELWAPSLFGVAVCGALGCFSPDDPAVEPAADRWATSLPSPSR